MRSGGAILGLVSLSLLATPSFGLYSNNDGITFITSSNFDAEVKRADMPGATLLHTVGH